MAENNNYTLITEDHVFKLNFKDPERHGIQVKDLANILLDINKITINLIKEFPELPNFTVCAKPSREGSYEIILQYAAEFGDLIIDQIDWATNTDQKRWLLEQAKNSFIWLFGIYRISKVSENLKLPFNITNSLDDNETVILHDENNNSFSVPKRAVKAFQKSKNIAPTLGHLFDTLENDDEIESVELKNSLEPSSAPVYSIPKHEFALLKTRKEDESNDELQYEHFYEQELTASDISYYSKGSWKMIWNGDPHLFSIETDIRLQMQDLRIGKKDKIIVDITIVKKFNSEYNVFENKKHIINFFHREILFEEPILPFK